MPRVHATTTVNGIDEDQRATMISVGSGTTQKAVSRKILIDSALESGMTLTKIVAHSGEPLRPAALPRPPEGTTVEELLDDR